MEFSLPQRTIEYREQLRSLLAGPTATSLLEKALSRSDGMDGDIRDLYRHLAEHGLLAPAWPVEHGGRGGDFTETVVLLEEFLRHHIPHSLYHISIEIVGRLLINVGSAEQKSTLLKKMARGELFACILLTEPETGSDLASLQTRAVRSADCWRLRGTKRYNLKTAYADLAMCAARSDDTGSKYEGISLFLVPMHGPGVRVTPIPSISDEQFHDVRLSDVEVPADAVIGPEGAGWSLITGMFTAERTGVDYYARGQAWLEQAAATLRAGTAPVPDAVVAGLARQWARVDASRLLASRALHRLQDGRPEIAEASLAKWHASESAAGVARWALDGLGTAMVTRAPGPAPYLPLEAAYREAAGLTISGGSSEVLLELVARTRFQPAEEA
jgi:acyl-CoA dehydrogenase